MVKAQVLLTVLIAGLSGGLGYAAATYRISATATAMCPEPARHGLLPPAGMPAAMPKGATW